MSIIVKTTICRALAYFDFALETGEQEPIEAALELLTTAVRPADNAGNVPLWWISNLCRHLVDDLWRPALHQNLPPEPPAGTDETYPDLRRLFIASLCARKTSEVELWPSQREAARRSTDVTDDLIVALPTSATRQRLPELALRMAFGARAADVVWLTIRRSFVMVAAGLVLGVADALVATRAMTSMLYGVTPNDPVTFAVVAALLSLTGIIASWLPARHAARIDPAATLRAE